MTDLAERIEAAEGLSRAYSVKGWGDRKAPAITATIYDEAGPLTPAMVAAALRARAGE